MSLSVDSALVPAEPVEHEAGLCPKCRIGALSYGGSGVQDEQYAYDWTCTGCGATGKEWHALVFEEHTLNDGSLPAKNPALKKFTVIAEYWDNEQGSCHQVEAVDDDEAIVAAQKQCREALIQDSVHRRDDAIAKGYTLIPELDEVEEEPLRIWAVINGWPKVAYMKSAEG